MTKRILLLQGPIGFFFAELQSELIANGHLAKHVIFNFADFFYCSKSNLKIYRKSEKLWEDWIKNQLIENKIDVLVFMGCERERHSIASKVAHELDIPIVSLEEGYVRPGFVTIEINGNNRSSPLKDFKVEDLNDDKNFIYPTPAKGHTFGKMAWFGFYYYILRVLGLPFFSRAVHHKNRKVWTEMVLWIRNAIRKRSNKSYNEKTIKFLYENYLNKFYIVPLQVRDDMQLVKAGRGWTNELVIEKSIASFAKHAPLDTALVIKVHPLERGHTNARKQIANAALAHKCEERVFFLDDGSIGSLTKDSAGMLTINSSSAFSAMLRNVPLGVLGDAMFRRDEIAICINDDADLDGFWSHNDKSRIELANRFRNYLRTKALFPGDYYLKENRSLAIKNVINFIEKL